MLDFGALPPEINSARMYAGPGSTSLMVAASAWNGLAAELSSAATGYDAVVTRLASEEWLGPASKQMAEAAAPYVAWMGTTAAQAEQAATQARVLAAAYETAFTGTVPPPLIAANRAQLAQAVSTNVFGQNTLVIAQLEAQYGEMWAQDAATMYGYAGQAATAANVTPFTEPATTTNPAGQGLQAAAVTQAAGTGGESTLAQLVSSVPTTLHNLAAPAASSSPTSSATGLGGLVSQLLTGKSATSSSLSDLVNAWSPYAGYLYNTEGLPYFSVGMGNNFVQMAKTLGMIGGSAPAAATAVGNAAAAAGALPGLGGLGGVVGGGAAVSAGLGGAGSISGALSVPPAWAGASGPLPASAAPVPVTSISAAPDVGGAGNLLGGMPLAHGGAAMGGAAPRYGFRPTVMARPPFAG